MIEGKHYIAFTQPYFFPYIGYWQLIHAADLFLIGDNVHYIKHHWINRNRILGEGGQPQYFGIEVCHASCNRLICETKRVVSRKQAEYMCRVLRFYYSKAPHFLLKHMRSVAEYIGIKTEIRLLSEVTARWDCKAPELIRRTCEHFGYTNFINSINGTKYYTKEAFREMGINLHFLRRNDDIRYRQFTEEFVPDLSIIDVMMFCSRDEIHDMLNRYHFA